MPLPRAHAASAAAAASCCCCTSVARVWECDFRDEKKERKHLDRVKGNSNRTLFFTPTSYLRVETQKTLSNQFLISSPMNEATSFSPLRLSLVGAPLSSSHPAIAATTGPPAPPRSFPRAFYGAFLALGRSISHHWWLWSLGARGTCGSGVYGARGANPRWRGEGATVSRLA